MSALVFNGQSSHWASEFYSLVKDSFCHFAHDDVEYHDYRHQKKNQDGWLSKSEQTAKRSEGEDKRGTNNHYGG
jgi:hypothetical protein